MNHVAHRLAIGLGAARKRSRQGAQRFYTSFARRAGLRGMHEVVALTNPMRKRAPRRAVRIAVERATARWPDPITARQWVTGE